MRDICMNKNKTPIDLMEQRVGQVECGLVLYEVN